MLKNAKNCPKCHVPIDKNGGCMHMTCKNCKYEFCWICLGDWAMHCSGKIQCNKFVASTGAGTDKYKLEKLGFYRDRFENHYLSIPKAEAKRKQILKNMENVIIFAREHNMSMNHLTTPFDDKNLKEALDLIVEARRAITMTYAFGYFWNFHKRQQELFEYQQGRLWEFLDSFDRETDAYQDSSVLHATLLDCNGDGKFMIGTKFLDFTFNLNDKVKNLTKICNLILKYIEDDLVVELNNPDAVSMYNYSEYENVLQSKPEPNMWPCSECTYFNEPQLTFCEMCQTPRTGMVAEDG